ncbi:MAG TPA: hypothetical protein GX708_16740 [Gallicola sp.]|nr:hypothetical protein [Gallicola sp.]
MKKYNIEDLEILIQKNDYLLDMAHEMVEGAISSGYYEGEIIDSEFIRGYLLAEINEGTIPIEKEI